MNDCRVSRLDLLAGAGAAMLAAAVPLRARAQSADHVSIGTPGQQGNAGVYYAQDMGFFKKTDLAASITTLRRGSGAGIVAAVVGGSLDVGEADLVSIAAARQHGIGVSLLAPSAFWVNTAPTAGLVVGKTAALNRPKDFAGKTIGVPSLEGLSRISANLWLERGGCDLAAVKFVEIPSATMSASILRGSVDAAVITEPTLSLALADGNRTIGSTYDAVAKQFIETAWFASDQWIASNPQAAVKFATAIRDAQRWANANQPQAQAIFSKYSGVAIESLAHSTFTRYGDVLVPALMQPLIDAGVRYHAIPAPVAARDLISSAVASAAR